MLFLQQKITTSPTNQLRRALVCEAFETFFFIMFINIYLIFIFYASIFKGYHCICVVLYQIRFLYKSKIDVTQLIDLQCFSSSVNNRFLETRTAADENDEHLNSSNVNVRI